MPAFSRRYYQNFRVFWQDVRKFIKSRKEIRKVTRHQPLSRAFRERLMVAVTAVNGCRYCQFAHARIALRAGIPEEELRQLLNGELVNSPPDEVPALLFAQHWAESGGNPDPSVRQSMAQTYGTEEMDAIELTLRTIQIGNLLGNTWDYFLHKISFGRWGR
jgi:AhpD family alkylhydroperoxidase